MTPKPRPIVTPAQPARSFPRFSLGFLLILAGLLAASAGPARAGQVVRFKTGFELAAKTIRYDGQTVYVTLDAGNEVGFPTWTIDEVISDDNIRFTPDGPGLPKVGGRVAMNGSGAWASGGIPKSAREFMILNSDKVISSKNGKSIPVGYSFGNEDQSFRGTPTGPVSSSGKVGKGIREEGAKTHAGLAPNGQPGGGGVKVMKPSAGPTQSTQ